MLEELMQPDIPRFPVEAGHIMMFARAIGDPNPIYNDAAYAAGQPAGGIIAPPTFVEASIHYDRAFAFRPRIGEPWLGSAAEPSGVPRPVEMGEGTNLHASTRFEYHLPLRPGMELATRLRPGRNWSKSGKRGGVLHFREQTIEFLHEGKVAVSATTTGVRTELRTSQPVKPAGDSGSKVRPPLTLPSSYPNALQSSAAHVGMRTSAVVVENLSRAQIIQYAGAAGDFSPQHVDEVYNREVAGYPTVFSHGMLTMGATGRMLTDWLGDGRLLDYEFRFLAPVWPGDTLIADGEIVAVSDHDGKRCAEIMLETTTASGVRVGTGRASARL